MALVGDLTVRFRHAVAADRTALGPGVVLVSAPGHPAFPVRLGLEILGRCLDHLGHDRPVTLWDPCCGSGALATALGLAWRPRLRAVLASDVDPGPLRLARRNLALLSAAGVAERRCELRDLAVRHDKGSHRRALESADRLAAGLASGGGDLPVEVATADVFDPAVTGVLAERVRPEVVVADLPYGVRTEWIGPAGRGPGAEGVLRSIGRTLAPHAVIAVVVRDRRVPLTNGTPVLERMRSGHRAVVVVRAGDVAPARRDDRSVERS